jgi:hypothetical protein
VPSLDAGDFERGFVGRRQLLLHPQVNQEVEGRSRAPAANRGPVRLVAAAVLRCPRLKLVGQIEAVIAAMLW